MSASDRRNRARAAADRRAEQRRAEYRRISERISAERTRRLTRMDDAGDIARWDLEVEKATLASRTRIRALRRMAGMFGGLK